MTEPPKMKPGPKRLWLEALRSGEHQRLENANRLTDGKGAYCPLGLLALVSPVPEREWASESLLPARVREWAGVGEDPLDLTELSAAFPGFLVIASVIEAEL